MSENRVICMNEMSFHIYCTLCFVGYIAIGVAVVEILIVISACCLSREINNKYVTYSNPKARA